MRTWSGLSSVLLFFVACGTPKMIPVGTLVDAPCSQSSVVLDGLNNSSVYFGLSTVGDDVFFAWRQNGAPPSKIDRVHRNGSRRTTLYTSPDDQLIHSLTASGNDLYFLQAIGNAPATVGLFRIAASGGAPTQIGSTEWTGAKLVAVVSGRAYLRVTQDQGAQYERVDFARETSTIFAKIAGVGTPIEDQIVGGELYFAAAPAGGSLNLYHVSTSAAEATPVSLGTVGGQDCLAAGGTFVTPSKLVCGLGDIEAFDHHGVMPQTLLEKNLLHLRSVVATDGENLYVAERGDGRNDVGLSRIDTSASDLNPVGCVRRLLSQYDDGLHPDPNRVQVTLSATEIFWFEQRIDGRNMSVSLRRAPK